jgi:hypothetical protein
MADTMSSQAPDANSFSRFIFCHPSDFLLFGFDFPASQAG